MSVICCARADYSTKRANVVGDDVSSTSSASTVSLSPSHSPLGFTTKLSPASVPPPAPQHQRNYQQQYMTSLSPDHGLTPSSTSQDATTLPLQPTVAGAATASPTPASRTTSPELFVLPAEPRRRAGSRSKGNNIKSLILFFICEIF